MSYSILSPATTKKNGDDGHHPLIFAYADKGKKFPLKNEFMFGWLLPSAIHVMPYNI
jgi:hypothetical protein